jgi:hypothetical protein
MGTAIASFDQKLKNKTGLGTAKFSDTESSSILSMANLQ